MQKPVYLIDGSGYIFRAFYATPRLTNSAGLPTNAIYAFTRMIIKFLREANPEKLMMVFDAGRDTFRNQLYPEYKANRADCPPDLLQQMPYFRKVSKALGVPVYEHVGFEADDVIGTVASNLASHSIPVVVVSADKDLMQLVTKQVTIWDTMRDKRYGAAEVKEKLGVLPEQVIDYLAIAGDSSDNIPGLKGAGPKTAVQLVEGYGSVEDIIAAKDLILNDSKIRARKKIVERIEEDQDLIRLSKILVKVRTDIDLDLKAPLMDFISRQEPIPHEVEALARELDFQSLLADFVSNNNAHDELVASVQLVDKSLVAPDSAKELVSDVNLKQQQSFDFTAVKSNSTDLESFGKAKFKQNYSLIFDSDYNAWLENLKKQKHFAFDLETTSLNPLEAKILGFAFCWSDSQAFYLPIAFDQDVGGDNHKKVSVEKILTALLDIFSDKQVTVIGQNIKYDLAVLLSAFASIDSESKDRFYKTLFELNLFDTMLAAYLLHPDQGGYGLTALAKRYLNYQMIEFSDLVEKGGSFSDVPLSAALNYAAEDAHITWLIYQIFKPQIAENNLNEVCYNIENPLVPVLASIEHNGIALDIGFLKAFSQQLETRMLELEREVYIAADREFNIQSPKQLGEVLFDRLGLPTTGVKKTKLGYSTDHGVLEKLSGHHPVPALVLEYRSIAKLKGTYVDALPQSLSKTTGRLHTKLNQTIAATGRLSSSEPNLQNIPIQTELGRKVRRAFIPEAGNILISADYSQIELRLLAHLSGDKAMIEAFHQGVDIHEQTAKEILGKGVGSKITGEERRMGKTINFGIVYGMGAFRLSKELEISFNEAQEYIERYFARFPLVKEYFSKLEKQVDQGGEVRTLFGRRRLVQEINSDGRDRNFVKRAALNAPLQGSAADIIKLAMIKVAKTIVKDNLPLKMILQIHDELLFECPEEDADNLMEVIKGLMQQVVELKVPLTVGIGKGFNLDELH